MERMDDMDDMDRMDGMDTMDTDPTIAIYLNCTAADCRGSCYRINRILAGHPDPGPGSEVDGRFGGGKTCSSAKALARKWGKSVNTIYSLAHSRHMSLDEIDRYYTDRAEKAAFLAEMGQYVTDTSHIYHLLRAGLTFDEIRDRYRNHQQNVA